MYNIPWISNKEIVGPWDFPPPHPSMFIFIRWDVGWNRVNKYKNITTSCNLHFEKWRKFW